MPTRPWANLAQRQCGGSCSCSAGRRMRWYRARRSAVLGELAERFVGPAVDRRLTAEGGEVLATRALGVIVDAEHRSGADELRWVFTNQQAKATCS